MAYTVNKFDGTFLTTVADGTIDTTTDIRFVGKNYAGYGEIQNENFLHLMENFANTAPPPKKLVGQLWYDTTGTEKKLKFWDGTAWRTASGTTSSGTQPSGLMPGEFWWDSNAKQLYAYTGSNFVLIGPPVSPTAGVSNISVDTIDGRVLVSIKDNDQTVAVFSSYDEFTPSSPITNFPIIYKGITLPGVSTGRSSTFKLHGTATDADRLGGRTAAEFENLLQGIFVGTSHFSDNGFTLGNLNNLAVRYSDSEEKLLIENRLTRPLFFRIGPNDIAVIASDGVIPGSNNAYNLGSLSTKWKSVYATAVNADNLIGSLTGDVTGAITGNVRRPGGTVIVDVTNNTAGDGNTTFNGIFNGTFTGNISGSTDSAASLNGFLPSKNYNESTSQVEIVGNTVVVRTINGDIHARNIIASGSVNRADKLAYDGSFYTASSIVPIGTDKRSIAARDTAGDIEARLFKGTATAARYADLAEKYLADAEYEVGTVVAVGGKAEVTATTQGDYAIGVVSKNPAFMMNKDLEGGTYIALKGRVPVKVVGAVKKGQRLTASYNGTAVATVSYTDNVFAIALESSDNTEVKLIEAVIL